MPTPMVLLSGCTNLAHFPNQVSQTTNFHPYNFASPQWAALTPPGEISKAVFREAHRVARPGGYYYPIDFRSGRQAVRRSAYGMFGTWWDHRWNNERWSLEFRALAFEDEMERVGFVLNPKAKAALPGFGIRHAIKQA
jgi:hypothetical protein